MCATDCDDNATTGIREHSTTIDKFINDIHHSKNTASTIYAVIHYG